MSRVRRKGRVQRERADGSKIIWTFWPGKFMVESRAGLIENDETGTPRILRSNELELLRS